MSIDKYLEEDDRKFYVYKMYDENEELLYVGKTTRFDARMIQHFSKDTIEKQPWKEDVNYIKYFELYAKVDMDMTELYLIATERPKHNELSTDTTLPKNKFEINKKKYDKIIEIKMPKKKIENLKSWNDFKNEIKDKINIYKNNNFKKISKNDIWSFSRNWFKKQK